MRDPNSAENYVGVDNLAKKLIAWANSPDLLPAYPYNIASQSSRCVKMSGVKRAYHFLNLGTFSGDTLQDAYRECVRVKGVNPSRFTFLYYIVSSVEFYK